MRTNILIILLFSFYLSFSQTDNPIVDKIRNIKELYDMDVISKKEYDSITKILVNDLVNQKSSSNLLLGNKTEAEGINTQPSKTEYVIGAYGWYEVWKTDENGVRYKIATVKNPGDELKGYGLENQKIDNPSGNQMNSQENLGFVADMEYSYVVNDSWGISFGYGIENAKISTDGFSEKIKGNGWSLGIVNRWASSDAMAWEFGLYYGQSKVDDDDYDVGDESSSAIGLSIGPLLYLDPIGAEGVHIFAQLGVSHSLEEEVEGVKQLLGSIGFGLGVDISDEFTLSVGYATNITQPYEGYLSDWKYRGSSIGVRATVRFN